MSPSACRDEFPGRWPMPTRWSDNDHYGHVNNVAYYSYFDTAVNAWLIDTTGLDVRELGQVGVVVSSSCDYIRPISFPDQLEVGLAVTRIGTTSVTYRLAIFRLEENEASAIGQFVHVYVDATEGRPTPIPDVVRRALEQLTVSPA